MFNWGFILFIQIKALTAKINLQLFEYIIATWSLTLNIYLIIFWKHKYRFVYLVAIHVKFLNKANLGLRYIAGLFCKRNLELIPNTMYIISVSNLKVFSNLYITQCRLLLLHICSNIVVAIFSPIMKGYWLIRISLPQPFSGPRKYAPLS